MWLGKRAKRTIVSSDENDRRNRNFGEPAKKGVGAGEWQSGKGVRGVELK